MEYCKCGHKVIKGICTVCGTIYNTDIFSSFDESNKITKLKNFIIYDSNLLINENYLEENMPFIDIIVEDYQKQVREFLDSITDSELYCAKEEVLNRRKRGQPEITDMSIEILKELGFEYVERE